MSIYQIYRSSTFKSVAIVVATAVVVWSIGFPTLVQNAGAANVTNVSDTLSDSDLGVVSNHTIRFGIPNGMLQGETFTITFPAGFDLGSITEDDIDLSDDGTDQTTAAAAGAGTWGVVPAGQVITFTTPTDGGVGSSSAMVVSIGDHASSSGSGSNQILNPGTAGSYEIDIAGTMPDSGHTRVAIIDNVVVTATVDTTFVFTIAGVANGTTTNGSGTTTATTTTASSLPFETLSAGTGKTLAQDLTVTTNASNGFTVTVHQDQNLQSSTGADIDGFSNGSYVDTPTAWESPTNNISNENTWGHWALTSEDSDLNSDEFGNDLWVAASTTPREVFHHNGPADGSTVNIGATRVGYQVQVTSLQEAGDDYTTTLTYIATPTF